LLIGLKFGDHVVLLVVLPSGKLALWRADKLRLVRIASRILSSVSIVALRTAT
jgi:hypothetical protein